MRNIVRALMLAAAIAAPMIGYSKTPNNHAKSAAPAVWVQEPDGFLGIKFGQSFPDAATIPDCPKYLGAVYFRVVRTMSSLCFDGPDRFRYGDLWNLPDLGFPYSVSVMLDGGTPTSFVVQTEPEHFDSLLKVLVQRYGPPSSTSSGKVQSKAGAEFDNQNARWSGKKVTINADMRSGQIDTSKAFISDRTYWDARERAADKASTEGAAKL